MAVMFLSYPIILYVFSYFFFSGLNFGRINAMGRFETDIEPEPGRKEGLCSVFLLLSLVVWCFVMKNLKHVSVVLPLTDAHYIYEETSLVIYLERICESSG
jgi:hypothetical protein